MSDPRPAGPYSIGSDLWPGTSKLLEEMGELNQVLGKLMGVGGDTHQTHWDGTDLRERLHEELADVSAALQFFILTNELDLNIILDRTVQKRRLFETWHAEHKLKESP